MTSVAFENRKVLVLNKSWAPVGVRSLERAMGLLFATGKDNQPKARILVPSEDFTLYTWDDWATIRPKNGEDVIHAGRGNTFRIPEIILLSHYNKMPHQRVHFSRRTIYKRDNFTCQYCGCKPGSEELTIDHVVPRAQGGLTEWTNCVLACVQCNSQKAARRPEQAFRHLLSKEQQKFWRGPSPMRAQNPIKPKVALFKGDRAAIPKSWEHFISEAYWDVPLDNDMEPVELVDVDD